MVADVSYKTNYEAESLYYNIHALDFGLLTDIYCFNAKGEYRLAIVRYYTARDKCEFELWVN